MNMGRTPGVGMIAPGICAGLDAHEAIAAFVIGRCPPSAGKIRVKRCGMLIPLMDISASCVGLPHLNQRIPNRPAVLVENAPRHNDTLAEGFARMLPR